MSTTGRSTNRVMLKPGHSLMDWIKLTAQGKDLSGTGGKMPEVTPQELEKHKSKTDCWICIERKVYNVTPYLEYHPGGPEQLLKGGGKDATDLFNSIHSWVNYNSMLSKCYVGKLKAGTNATKAVVPKPKSSISPAAPKGSGTR